MINVLIQNWMRSKDNIPQWENWIFFVIAAGGVILCAIVWLITSKLVNNRRFQGGYEALEHFGASNDLQLGNMVGLPGGQGNYLGQNILLETRSHDSLPMNSGAQSANTQPKASAIGLDQNAKSAKMNSNEIPLPNNVFGSSNFETGGNVVIDASQFEEKSNDAFPPIDSFSPFGQQDMGKNNPFAGNDFGSMNDDFMQQPQSQPQKQSQAQPQGNPFNNQKANDFNQQNNQNFQDAEEAFSPYDMGQPTEQNKKAAKSRSASRPDNSINMTMEDRTGKKIFKVGASKNKKPE